MLSGSPVPASLAADQLLDRFLGGSPRQRRSLLASLQQRSEELAPLVEQRLDSWDATGDDWACGSLLQLVAASGASRREGLLARYPDGWLATPSAQAIEYGPLQRHLLLQEWEAADRSTSELLRQLAGAEAQRRGYVYYSEVGAMPAPDLESLDRLWLV